MSQDLSVPRALRYVLRDPDRKSLAKIILEMVRAGALEREIPLYYFTSLLHKKDSGDLRDYIGRKRIHRIKREYFNAQQDYEPLENKLSFGRIVESASLPMPKILGYTEGRTVHLSSGVREDITSADTLMEVIESLREQSRTSGVFIKPADGMNGKSTLRLADAPSLDAMSNLFVELRRTNFLIQEIVEQHETLNRLYARSINTVRVHTLKDPETGQVAFFGPILKLGRGGRIVDNGGIFVDIDVETWKLGKTAYSSLQRGGGSYSRHPDTGVKLDGYQLPFADEIKSMCCSAAAQFEKPFIGWDVAIAPNGPVLIEGNHNPHLIMAQVAAKGVRTNSGYRKAFDGYL